MQKPTLNPITQGKHGVYNAVDYSALPDPLIYAPEDGTVISYAYNGKCGNNMQMNGATGRHGFCHLQVNLVGPGTAVKRGQPIGIMGYTGLTIPAGVGGSHLHWVLYKNGVYVYPENYVNQSFIKKGETNVAVVQDAENWYARLNKLHMQILNAPLGRDTFKQLVGWDTLKVIELFSDHSAAPGVQAAQEWGVANRTIVEAKIAELNKQNEEKNKLIADLQAQLAVQSDDTKLLNGFGEWLRKIIVRLGLKG